MPCASAATLARISPRFAPLLYNRRHLGVAAFLLMFAGLSFGFLNFVELFTATERSARVGHILLAIAVMALALATARFPTMRPRRAWCILLKTRFRRNGPAFRRASGRRSTSSNSRARVSRS